MMFGNEGDDWIEHGMADGSAGENFDVRGLDSIVGNDVFIGDSRRRPDGRRRRRRHHGRQRRQRADRYLGASGFDWAVFQHDTLAANVDLNLRAFDETPVPLSVASIPGPVRVGGRSVGIGSSATSCAATMPTRP